MITLRSLHSTVKMALLCLILLGMSSVQTVTAKIGGDERRVALLIGNSNYDGLQNLPNAKNDVKLMSKKLKSLGFEVTTVKNTSREKMLKSINDFGQMLNDVDVSLFYYAGHAVQHNNVNYMIPAKGASKINNSSLEYDAIDLNRVIAQMRDAKSSTNIIVMDACRDNPFKSSVRARGLGGTTGLAVPSTNARGLYIAYSTSPGAVALDNSSQSSRYSPYTESLANYIDKPGLGINEIFTRVRSEVIQKTGNAQVPWEVSSLTSDFYFSGEQTEAEKENERKIEDKLAALKAELEATKRAAEEQRRQSLEILERNKINTQTLFEEKESTQSALELELASLRAKLAESRAEQVELEATEAARIKRAEKENQAAILEQKAKIQEQKRIASEQQRIRQEKEQAELRRIEALELEESVKQARLLEEKKKQAERELEIAKSLLEKEKQARIEAEARAQERERKNTEATLAAKQRLAELIAKQEASQIEAARLELLRQQQIDAEKQKMAEEKTKLLEELAVSESKRLEQEALARSERESAELDRQKQLQALTERLEQEELKRKAREKQLVVAMVKNCDDLLRNSAQGAKVLKCYKDVLEIDGKNNDAKKGLAKLERAYQKLLANSLKREKLNKVDSEYAILQEIDPEKAARKYSKSIEELRQKYINNAEESSKLVLPTF